MKLIYSDKIMYVVTIPWDSASISESYIFTSYIDASAFCDQKNAEGYNGYCGGLAVHRCSVISSIDKGAE
jgi:hypothetical protein